MGYYVIPDPQRVPLKSFYVATYAEIAMVEGLSGKSIVYQAGLENYPIRIDEAEEYKHLSKEGYIAGVRARSLFAGMARRCHYIVEEIRQEQLCYDKNRSAVSMPVKRGDFFVRNLGNLEIEVKCRTFYKEKGEEFFYFSKEDLEKHFNMQCYTQTPVVIAVFRRNGTEALPDSLCMIKVNRIKELETIVETEVREYGIAYRIPVRETITGFGLLDDYSIHCLGQPTPQVESSVSSPDEMTTNQLKETENRNVLVVFFNDTAHWNWIMKEGYYNVPREIVWKRFGLKDGVKGIRYLLLHTEKEIFTDKLLEVVGGDPVLWTDKELIARNYPSEPNSSEYWIYQVRKARILQEKCWSLKSFTERISKYPWIINLKDLTAEAYQIGKMKRQYPRTNYYWMPEEDELLKQLFQANVELEEMARRFGRKPSAIYMRIEKLRLRKQGGQ